MAHPAGKLLTGFFVVAALLVVATLVVTRNQAPPAPSALPRPNGYDDLVQASRMLADKSRDAPTMSEPDLRPLVAKNADALKLARAGLGRDCQVPLDFSHPNPSYFTNLARCKALAQAFAAEGRLYELDNRPTDAADSYLTVIHLGIATSKGGLLIDSLVGIAIEAIGTVRLEKLALTLDAKECRQAVTAIESFNSSREPMTTAVARERVWARRAYGIRGQIARLVNFKSTRQVEQGIVAKVSAQQVRERSLLLHLAARAYELENNKPPRNLTDLVPTYLKSIPQNPATGTNMTLP